MFKDKQEDLDFHYWYNFIANRNEKERFDKLMRGELKEYILTGKQQGDEIMELQDNLSELKQE